MPSVDQWPISGYESYPAYAAPSKTKTLRFFFLLMSIISIQFVDYLPAYSTQQQQQQQYKYGISFRIEELAQTYLYFRSTSIR